MKDWEFKMNSKGSKVIAVKTFSNGIKQTRVYRLDTMTDTRVDCYCCSCPDIGMSDPHCRMHGWSGRRPCEIHQTPGAYSEEVGEMPVTVQKHKKLLRNQGRV